VRVSQFQPVLSRHFDGPFFRPGFQFDQVATRSRFGVFLSHHFVDIQHDDLLGSRVTFL
jgi:hypothetical protein